MPLVRASPPSLSAKRPNHGQSPKREGYLNGEAEPRRTSGGEAATKRALMTLRAKLFHPHAGGSATSLRRTPDLLQIPVTMEPGARLVRRFLIMWRRVRK